MQTQILAPTKWTPSATIRISELAGWTMAISLGKSCGIAYGMHGALFLGSFTLRGRYAHGRNENEMLAAALKNYDDLRLSQVFLVQPIKTPPPTRSKKPQRTRFSSWNRLADQVTEWALDRGSVVEVLDVGSVKKNFTGFGNASADKVLDESDSRGFYTPMFDRALALATFDLGYYRGCQAVHG